MPAHTQKTMTPHALPHMISAVPAPADADMPALADAPAPALAATRFTPPSGEASAKSGHCENSSNIA